MRKILKIKKYISTDLKHTATKYGISILGSKSRLDIAKVKISELKNRW